MSLRKFQRDLGIPFELYGFELHTHKVRPTKIIWIFASSVFSQFTKQLPQNFETFKPLIC